MRKRFGIILASLLCAVAALGGCGKQAEASKEGVRIFFSLNSIDTFRGALVEAAQAAAKERGAQLETADAQGLLESQMNQIKEAAAGGYDVILCSPVLADTAVELKASAGSLPIVFVNSCPDDRQLEKGQYIYAGSDESTAGQYQAEYVLNQLPDKEEINVVLLKGEAGHSGTTGRTKGIKKTFAASGRKVNYVFEDYADWDTQKAEKLFKVFLRTGVEADCVICNNDSMALGVANVCKDAGIDLSRLLILGVDATEYGCEAVENGEMAFTVYQSAAGQGKAAVEAAIELSAGASAEDVEGITDDGKYVWVPFEKVDKGNVGEYK